MARQCLICGTRACGPTTIIGGSCPGDPIWDVPCITVPLDDQACGSAGFLDPGDVTFSFSEPVEIER
jgi:hypothetical protein